MSNAYKQTMGVAYPIESVNRKLALRSEVAGSGKKLGRTHEVKLPGVKFIGGFVRHYGVVTGNNKITHIAPQCLFVRKYGRSSIPGADELTRREIFAAASQGTAALMKNLSQISRIQLLFNEAISDMDKHMNGVSVEGYANLRSWVFAVQYAGKKEDPQYDVNTFPQGFDA